MFYVIALSSLPAWVSDETRRYSKPMAFMIRLFYNHNSCILVTDVGQAAGATGRYIKARLL